MSASIRISVQDIVTRKEKRTEEIGEAIEVIQKAFGLGRADAVSRLYEYPHNSTFWLHEDRFEVAIIQRVH